MMLLQILIRSWAVIGILHPNFVLIQNFGGGKIDQGKVRKVRELEQNKLREIERLSHVRQNAPARKLYVVLPILAFRSLSLSWLLNWFPRPMVKLKSMAQHDEEMDKEGNVQWVLAKAGKDRIYVVVLEVLGWLCEEKKRAAESLEAEATRYHRAAERKLHEVEEREDDLRRRIVSSKSDFEAKEKENANVMQQTQKVMQQTQERLLDAQALLNQREEYVLDKTKELKRLERELGELKLSTSQERMSLNEEKISLELKASTLSAREEAVIKRECDLLKKEEEALLMQAKIKSSSMHFDVDVKESFDVNPARLVDKEETYYAHCSAILTVKIMLTLAFNSNNYLSLKWSSDLSTKPTVKMKLMNVPVDSCKVLKSGGMTRGTHMHTQHDEVIGGKLGKQIDLDVESAAMWQQRTIVHFGQRFGVDARAVKRLDNAKVKGNELEQYVAAFSNYKTCVQAKKLMETECLANACQYAQLRELATILSVIRNLKRLFVRFPKPMVKMKLVVLILFCELLREADMLGVSRRNGEESCLPRRSCLGLEQGHQVNASKASSTKETMAVRNVLNSALEEEIALIQKPW